MTSQYTPLQAHLQHIFDLREKLDGWRIGRQVVTNEHLRNIQKSFSEYSQTDTNHPAQAQEFPQYLATNDSYQPTIMGEVFADTAYLEQNPSLNDETKLKFIKRVANRALDLNIFGAYDIVISTLDDYLRRILRLDFNISEEALYVQFVAGIKSTSLCHYITDSQAKLPERDCQYIIEQLSQISGFNLQDFSEYPIFAQYAKTENQS